MQRFGCPTCAAAIAAESRFCPHCGTEVLGSETPYAIASSEDATPGRMTSAEARFTPGEIVAGRYRIVARAGRGGMGEVFRADDLKLGQSVALKFLPVAVENDPVWLERLLGEVRVARQVSHPNVCRVYDIGVEGGRHFLTMELIEGEDLASLLRRIGRLPYEKALEIARQLCAGLAAAHDRGVLHRDLKPANVMLDERGSVRITDFGLAVASESVAGLRAREGTPAYMAPEQLEGQAVTKRSDLYALGLVLYELFTGRRPYSAQSVPDLLAARRDAEPPSISSQVGGVDLAVERAVKACLRADPSQRPSSAMHVLGLLPGGDPLAAALAAGETPSPDAVAAATTEGVRAPVVLGLTMAIVALIALAMAVQNRHKLYRQIDLPYSRAQLSLRADQILRRIDPRRAERDIRHGFEVSPDVTDQIREGKVAAASFRRDLEDGRLLPLFFWYRTSLAPLVSNDEPPSAHRPPPQTGDESVVLDPHGRLRRLLIVPSGSPAAGPDPDWALHLLQEADVGTATLRPSAPADVPPVYADERKAWRGAGFRVEAAALSGRPVWFEVIPDGAAPAHTASNDEPVGRRMLIWMIVSFYIVVLVVASFLARRNLRAGRGDRRGATRVAVFLFLGAMASWIVGGPHVASIFELQILTLRLGGALIVGAGIWLCYIALEPIVRRLAPHRLISWTRLWSGKWSDPIVGRDILAGLALGLVASLGDMGTAIENARQNGLEPITGHILTNGLDGPAALAQGLMQFFLNSIIVGICSAVFAVLLFIFLRRHFLAGLAFWLLFLFVVSLEEGPAPTLLLLNAVSTGAFVIAIMRFGLLATVIAQFAFFLPNFFPIVPDLGRWYGAAALAPLGILAALTLVGAYGAIGGTSWVRSLRLLPD
jgi:hypothetical protein